MFTRELHWARLLASVSTTPIFQAYCEQHQLPFASLTEPCPPQVFAQALAALPATQQARVEQELAQVNELADASGNAHLAEVAPPDLVPPADIPSGAAYALWFLVHAPEFFASVFFRHQVHDVHTWRVGRAPPAINLPDTDLRTKEVALADALRAFLGKITNTATYGHVQAHRLPELLCFSAHLADRPHFVDTFSDAGELVLQRLRPALVILFAYTPTTGHVYLQAPFRSRERLIDLFRCFGQAVLGSEVTLAPHLYQLDRLQQAMPLLPDAPDMEAVRLKAITLQYPAYASRRSLRLETRTNDAPEAIAELLRTHRGPDAHDLTVVQADLQVRLRTGQRAKSMTIRLWPDRSNLPRTALGERLRQCLIRWGLTDA